MIRTGLMDKTDILSNLAKFRKIGEVKAMPPGMEEISTVEMESASLQRLLEGMSRVSQSDLRLLKEAGWKFIAAVEGVDGPGLDVLVDSDGNLKLLGRSLVVKIDPSLGHEEIETLLSRSGLVVRRKLGFAPNTFVLDAENGSALSIAESLNALEEIVYAEPNIIEPIRGRSRR